MVKTINVKENNNSFEYANFVVETEIEDAKKLGVNVLIVIHGYGSSGSGGVIKTQLHEFLHDLKKFKKIKDYIKGEHWASTNLVVAQMLTECPDLIVNSQLSNLNSGVTIIWVN